MSELQPVFLTGMGAVTVRGDATLHGSAAPFIVRGDEDTELPRIENFKVENYISSQKTYLDRCSALALAGCALALRDADLAWPMPDDTNGSNHFGITLGTHLGCIETMKEFWGKAVERGTRLANPLLFSHSYFNTPISLCAIEFGLKGYHATLCAGHESGIEAVRAAYDAIRLGHATAMLCGGVEALTPVRMVCEPTDRMGEAAVFFVLESAGHAEGRAAPASHTVNDETLEAAIAARDIARSQFGDCGAAASALALAVHFAKNTSLAKKEG